MYFGFLLLLRLPLPRLKLKQLTWRVLGAGKVQNCLDIVSKQVFLDILNCCHSMECFIVLTHKL